MNEKFSEKKGRFIVQEIEDVHTESKKSRHYSMNRLMTHLYYSTDFTAMFTKTALRWVKQ